jgi:hypothetical protein
MVEARSRPRATKRGLEDCRRFHPDRRLTADGRCCLKKSLRGGSNLLAKNRSLGSAYKLLVTTGQTLVKGKKTP